MGLFFPVVSSSLAAFFFYFGMIQRAPWDSRVQFATTLTWRLGVPAFAPALAHQHGVPFAGASSVLVFASVAAHDRRYICRELCMIDFAACWLLSMALASMATSVCRKTPRRALSLAGVLCLFGLVLLAQMSGGITIRHVWLAPADLVHTAEALALGAAGAHALAHSDEPEAAADREAKGRRAE